MTLCRTTPHKEVACGRAPPTTTLPSTTASRATTPLEALEDTQSQTPLLSSASTASPTTKGSKELVSTLVPAVGMSMLATLMAMKLTCMLEDCSWTLSPAISQTVSSTATLLVQSAAGSMDSGGLVTLLAAHFSPTQPGTAPRCTGMLGMVKSTRTMCWTPPPC